MFEAVTTFFAALPFTRATWFTLFTLFFFVWLFAKASRDPFNPIKWEHLIVDSQNDRASPYKVGYLIGLIVGTWIILRLSDSEKLTYDMLGMYLTYLLGGAGVNSFAKSKTTSYPQYASQEAQQNRRIQRPVYDGTSDGDDVIPKP